MDKSVKEILDKWGQSIVNEIITRLTNSGKVATGNLRNSIDYEIDDTVENQFILYFTALDYAIYVDKGRKPGKQPPLNKIKEWCKVKGLPEKLAFPIAKNIGLKGIRPTNIFSITINRRIPSITKELVKSLGENIKEQLIGIEGLGKGQKII